MSDITQQCFALFQRRYHGEAGVRILVLARSPVLEKMSDKGGRLDWRYVQA
ncbi:MULTISPECIES: hypothetical protein [Komagataeibacter]|uniref:hypothetical protein n=1 Tax=Komagataeibacter TaxID=1434011 RepID=UPI000237ECDD|nr:MULTISPECIES: hypothetical protein [Komagataeibacter]MBV1825964.1 hypothetical protein [Komagataeibacter oboediens]